MGRYVMATRRSAAADAVASAERWLAEHEASMRALRVSVREGLQPRLLAVLDGPDDFLAALPCPPWMLLEREIRHEIAARRARIVLTGPGPALAGALVLAVFRNQVGELREEYTEADDGGMAEFEVDPATHALERIMVKPRHSYWTRVALELDPGNRLSLTLLPAGPIGWWHRVVGAAAVAPDRGAGIRVAVLDTGCGPNPCLQHVTDAGSIQDLKRAADGRDHDGHGSHVCGLIGARAQAVGDFMGIAPGVDLTSVRVCDATNTTNQADIAAALDLCVHERDVHLVNMSLASDTPSAILQEALLDLLDAGVLPICAAGNASTTVWYPAAFEEAVAVSALGLDGWAEPFSISSGQRPDEDASDHYGRDQLFFARFSCAGPEVTCIAPGVGIISTVASATGQAVFAEMDGTSMASPIACGALAVRLSGDERYRELSRDEHRAAYALDVLRRNCHDAGFRPELQGYGIPQAT